MQNLNRGGGALNGEMFDVLDVNGLKTGQTKSRSEVHRDGDYHRTIFVWVVNQQNEVLLQLRAPNKETFPDFWDISVAGHVVAGEDSRSAAVQEIAEEIGIKIRPEDLEYLMTWVSSTNPKPGFINNSFNDLYLLRTDKAISELTMQPEEVSELRYISIVELYRRIQEHDIKLTPHDKACRKLFQIFGLIDE